MPDIEAIEVLTQAKERLFDCGWGKFTADLRTRQGDTESFCLEEALMGQRGRFMPMDAFTPREVVVLRAERYIRAATGTTEVHLFMWNDTRRSAGEVLDSIDRAIEIAKDAHHEV